MSTPSHDLLGRTLHDSDGRPIGKITGVCRYPTDLNAPWGAAAVTHGRIVKATHLVDLEDAALDGEAVKVPHTRHTITTAPNYQPLVGNTLAEHDAVEVRAHYWGAGQLA